MIIIDRVLRRATGAVPTSPRSRSAWGSTCPRRARLMVVLGALAGWYFDRHADRRTNPAGVKQLGVLLASGLIVGEGLIGVLIAALVAFSGKDFPLSLVSDSFADSWAVVLSTITFAVTMVVLYRWVSTLASIAGQRGRGLSSCLGACVPGGNARHPGRPESARYASPPLARRRRDQRIECKHQTHDVRDALGAPVAALVTLERRPNTPQVID